MRDRVLNAGLFAGLLVALASGPVVGQDSTYRSVAVVTGRQVRLSLHFNLNKDCSPAGPPKIRVIAPPRHGTLSIRGGTARAERVRNCEKVQTPVRLVLYASNPGYIGEDQVTYEVTRADGITESQVVAITVKAAPAGPPNQGNKTIDL
jgi:hypothetical protein